MNIISKLPNVGTTIFTVMSALANKHNAINLSQGFPNFDCSDRLKSLVYQRMQEGYNQYCPMGGAPVLTEQLAIKIEQLYGLSVDPSSEITITAGATQAVFTAISAVVKAGDEVILVDPAYDCYRPTVELCGGIPVNYELQAPDYSINWVDFAKLITDKTTMIIINSPQNPTGSILTELDMLELQRLTDDTNIVVLSDEVYEHIIFDKEEHQSILRFPNLWNRCMATFSFGKTFHNTGWKMGYCVAPKALMKEFRKVHQFNVFTVNTPMQYGLAEFLKDPNEYLGLNAFYEQKRNFFLDLLKDTPFKFTPSKGTYFQLVDYSAISDEKDTDFAIRMTKEFGVAAIPVSVFYASGRDEKMVRLCFAKTEETLEKAGLLLQKIR